MTKTLLQLQEEHPEWCWRCGDALNLEQHEESVCAYRELPILRTLIAAKWEDEATIAELEKRAEFFASLDHAWAVGMQEKNDSLQSQLTAAQATIAELHGAMRADDERLLVHGERVELFFGCDTAEHMADEIEALRDEERHLRSQLSAAQQAHEETKRQLEEADSMILSDQPAGQFFSTYAKALARQSQRADEEVERVMSMTEEEARRDCESRGTTLEAEAGKVREGMHRAVQRAADAAKEVE